ncbi:4-(cytidine 5'-diphospho)-2-C-methyl-D-erythritol kinase [Mycoavidus sp. B2-EB]|uniref:4-(cytidine 5'-diphospho)-2-C-methyl-D-erythritol kinase n=1 Tax=Mycoavidus sp. B2-EB TaxID=2651972 RepID=UPI001624F2DB|nr:4-(cytidine 5'-diphospho)-2-C-methyl-D-erythritol kinase [Mycoavidus sp. B2-EB]BBO59447.1 4-diphosphocytidyl-2-C-methyl-D-erythritol kinase [Mycoavidus sp. B2-EB]
MSDFSCLAPAKLNLFLHITGRRADGYHLLQTVFQLLDYGDTLHFKVRTDPTIERVAAVSGVSEASDLTLRAARALQAYAGCPLGVEIEVEKRIPLGAGLGGGSSDAASTLLALNRLWELNLSRAQLQDLAISLGADVPFFVFGCNAFAQGIGEQLQAVELPLRHFLVVTPPVQVATTEIFSMRELTRDTKIIKIANFLGQWGSAVGADAFGRNDMQSVVAGKYAEVAQVLDWFKAVAPARMTGSGASVFAVFASRDEALSVQAVLPDGWHSEVAASLESHPLLAFAL